MHTMKEQLLLGKLYSTIFQQKIVTFTVYLIEERNQTLTKITNISMTYLVFS